MIDPRSLALAAVATLLAACGGSSSTPAPTPTPEPNTVTITGVSATGAPIAAVLTVRCGNTFQGIYSAELDGTFSIEVPEGETPCIIRATGGNPFVVLYAIATGPGRTNVTPLTSLITSRALMVATGETSFPQFFSQGTIDLAPLVAELDAATTLLLADLEAAGYQFPDSLDPFSDIFIAEPGDLHDDLLEALAAAYTDAGQSFDQLVAAWLSGGDLPDSLETPASPDLIGGFSGTYNVEYVYEGMHTRGTVIIGGDNSVDFDTGLAFSSEDADAADVYDRIACCNRIDVDFGTAGYLRLYVSEGGVLRDSALIVGAVDTVVSFLGQLDEGDGNNGSLLEGNGIIGTIDGELRLQEAQEDPPFLIPVGDTFVLDGADVTAVWTIARVPSEAGVHYCSPTTNGTYIEYLVSPRVVAGGQIHRVGRCTITVTSITLDASNNPTSVEGYFAVELLTKTAAGQTGGNDFEIVTDGYFRFEP